MALTAKSLLLYGIAVTPLNSSIDFRRTSGGTILQATLTVGFYSLTDLLTEVKRAMQAADALNQYTVTADRSLFGGTQNRVTIATQGIYLDLLFASGPRAGSSAANLLGFFQVDRTGGVSYMGNLSCGIPLVPEQIGYNYNPPESYRQNFGQLNIAASGLKETIVFTTMLFLQVQFKYISDSIMKNDWANFMTWAIAQKPFEYIPEISKPGTFYSVTLEMTPEDGKGLAYRMTEMLGEDRPFEWDTGTMKFRLTPS